MISSNYTLNVPNCYFPDHKKVPYENLIIFFWYERAANELAKNAIYCEPYKHEIDKINTLIRKIDPFEKISKLVDIIIFFVGLLLIIPIILFISQPIGIVVIIFEIIVGLLAFTKKILLTKTELLQKINDKMVYDSEKIDKNFKTKEKLFALNVWNYSLSNKSTFSILLLLLFCKSKFPRLYNLIFFALIEVMPSYIPNTLQSNWLDKRIWLFNQYRKKKPIIDAKTKEILARR